MASSSSSSSSSSSPPFWKYDVFLSFRGEIRKSFVSHLYKELNQKGIKTFKDDPELERGSSISPALLTAIEESKFSIVVISQNYASSGWCLDELVKIMECNEKGRMKKVVPIFYEVDPSHVRKQTGSFAEAFEIHKVKYEDERVKVWKKALTDVANLAGEDSRNWKEDSELIQVVVEDILNRLNSTLPSDDSSHLVGVEAHMNELDHLLSIDYRDEVRVIGIWGMPGIGKTTIAWHLYNRFLRQFRAHCFIENVKDKYKTPRPTGLQEEFLSKILGVKDMKLQSFELGLRVIKERLEQQKVLLVLDDVDKIDQLDALIKESKWFGLGSRIIITTRDRRLLDSYRVKQVYKVKYLSNNDALELFCQFAFGQKQVLDGFKRLSSRAVRLARGLPLGLKVFGSFLSGQEREEWEIALHSLERTPDANVMEILKVCYDGLNMQHQSIFRHIACIFNGRRVDDVRSFLDGSNLSVDFGIKFLADKSLIDILIDGHITMHNLLQQMGREVVLRQSHKPGERQFLLDSAEIGDVLMYNTGSEMVEGISLNLSGKKEVCISDRAFEKMPNLKFFEIHNHQGEAKIHLPAAAVDYFPCKLRLLRWDAYPLETLQFRPECLVELNMKRSNLVKLWEDAPCLRNLKRIILDGSENLKEVPDLSNTINLEVLSLFFCGRLTKVSPSIESLYKLTKLDMGACTSLEIFPQISRNIRRLTLYCERINQVPESIGHLSRLVRLDMSNCKRLRNLPSTIGNLTALQSLHLDGCEMLENIPNTIRNLKCLETIWVWGGRNITRFPDLPENIRTIYFTGTMIEEIPSWIGNLSQLESLDVSGNKSLKILPASISKLKCLQNFRLQGCTDLESFPAEICETLSSLKEIDLRGTRLRELPESLGNLESLEMLYAGKTAMPLSIVNLTSLKMLWLLGDCYEPDGVPFQCPALSNFRFLTSLRLRNLNMLEIPSDLGQLCHLKFLDLMGNNFAILPASIKQLSKLKELYLSNCKDLQSLPELPRSLERLYVHGCASSKAISPVFDHYLGPLFHSNGFKLDMAFLQDEKKVSCFPGLGERSAFHRITWSSPKIHMPRSRFLHELAGLAACIMLRVESLHQIDDLSLKCKCRLQGGFGEIDFHDSLKNSGAVEDVNIESDHLFVFKQYSKSPYGDAEKQNLFDTFEFEFVLIVKYPYEQVTCSLGEIKECGVRLLFREDLDDKCDGMGMPSSPSDAYRDEEPITKNSEEQNDCDKSSWPPLICCENIGDPKDPMEVETIGNMKRRFEPQDSAAACGNEEDQEQPYKRGRSSNSEEQTKSMNQSS